MGKEGDKSSHEEKHSKDMGKGDKPVKAKEKPPKDAKEKPSKDAKEKAFKDSKEKPSKNTSQGDTPARKGNPGQRKCPVCYQFMFLDDKHEFCGSCRDKVGLNKACDGVSVFCAMCEKWTPEELKAFADSVKNKAIKARRPTPQYPSTLFQEALAARSAQLLKDKANKVALLLRDQLQQKVDASQTVPQADKPDDPIPEGFNLQPVSSVEARALMETGGDPIDSPSTEEMVEAKVGPIPVTSTVAKDLTSQFRHTSPSAPSTVRARPPEDITVVHHSAPPQMMFPGYNPPQPWQPQTWTDATGRVHTYYPQPISYAPPAAPPPPRLDTTSMLPELFAAFEEHFPILSQRPSAPRREVPTATRSAPPREEPPKEDSPIFIRDSDEESTFTQVKMEPEDDYPVGQPDYDQTSEGPSGDDHFPTQPHEVIPEEQPPQSLRTKSMQPSLKPTRP